MLLLLVVGYLASFSKEKSQGWELYKRGVFHWIWSITRRRSCPYWHLRQTACSLLGTFSLSKPDTTTWSVLTGLLGLSEEEDMPREACVNRPPAHGGERDVPAPGPSTSTPARSCSRRWALFCFHHWCLTGPGKSCISITENVRVGAIN